MSRLPDRRSPCRIDKAKGNRRHPCSAFHADLVDGYRSWRDSEYAAADRAAYGTPSSPGDEEYWLDREKPTFGRFLRDYTDRNRAEEEAA